MNLVHDVTKYLDDVTGIAPAIEPLPKGDLATLPVYLRTVFEIVELKISGHIIVAAIAKSSDKPDLSQLAKHRESLSEKLGRPAALVLPQIKSYERRRLIEKHIPFIVPGRQLYLPMMLVDIREYFPSPRRAKTETLSWVAQVIVLRHLLSDDIEEQPLARIASTLGYSAMAISQAVDELVAQQLCERVRRGRSKTIQFQCAPRATWQAAEPFMRSPVKKTHLARKLDLRIG